MIFERRRSSQKPTATTAAPTAMDQLPQPDDSTTPARHASKFRRISDSTVRHVSRPLSVISSRSSTSTRRQTPNETQRPSTQTSVESLGSRVEGLASSRRSSLLSTGESLYSRGEECDLGKLPVFGISQRAYLASLLSLFGGNENGSSHSTSMDIPEPSSGASDLGPYEYSIHSASIYEHAKSRRLYIGWPAQIHPPKESLIEFEMETLPRLERDLQGVSGYLGQQGIRITYELRMSGYASRTAETVTLSPTVWILYQAYTSAGAHISEAELHQAVADTFYLDRGPEVQEGGGRLELCSDRGLVSVNLDDKESMNLSDGGKLNVHIENCLDKDSVCGALACVTTEKDGYQVQSLCRIGGLLKVNGKYILGVSCAHAMIEESGIFRDSFDENVKTQLPAGEAADREMILAETSRVAKWTNVTRDAAVDFLGVSMNSRGEMAINRSKPGNATNFSLLRMRKVSGTVRNEYIPPGAKEAVRLTSTASASAAAMDEGPVHILCGGDDVAEGQLVWGSACFIVRARNFRVRRIQTSRPLSAATTGAWVAMGEVLYGVIIAVYENEPFALMMTVERLFASILGSAFSIRTVELWDGKVPEALKGVYEKVGSSKIASNSVPVHTGGAHIIETTLEGIEEVNENVDTPTSRPKSRPTTSSETRPPTSSETNPEATTSSETNSEGMTSMVINTEGTHLLLLPRPKTVDASTQTEEPFLAPPPVRELAAKPATPVSKPVEEQPLEEKPVEEQPVEEQSVEEKPVEQQPFKEPYTGLKTGPWARHSMHGRSESITSDMTMMSGAMPGDSPPASTKDKQERINTGDSAVSAGARTVYTDASEHLDRQDSGFVSETAPALANGNNDDTQRRGSKSSPGRSSSSDGGPRTVPPAATMSATTGLPKLIRLNNIQSAMVKPFRRPAGKDKSLSGNKDKSQDKKDDDPTTPTSSNGRSPLFHRRRSSVVKSDSKITSNDGGFGLSLPGSDGKRLKFRRRVSGQTSAGGSAADGEKPAAEGDLFAGFTGSFHRSSEGEERSSMSRSSLDQSLESPEEPTPTGDCVYDIITEPDETQSAAGSAVDKAQQPEEQLKEEDNDEVTDTEVDDGRSWRQSASGRASEDVQQPEEQLAEDENDEIPDTGLDKRQLKAGPASEKVQQPKEQPTKDDDDEVSKTGVDERQLAAERALENLRKLAEQMKEEYGDKIPGKGNYERKPAPGRAPDKFQPLEEQLTEDDEEEEVPEPEIEERPVTPVPPPKPFRGTVDLKKGPFG